MKPSLRHAALVLVAVHVAACARAAPGGAETPAFDPGAPAEPEAHSSPETDRTFRATLAPEGDGCSARAVHVQGPGAASHSCVPVVSQTALGEPGSWDHLVVVDAPRIALYDREQHCKSVACGYKGAMLPLDGERFIPLEGRKGDVWNTNGGLACGPGGRPPSFGCPKDPPARLLGIVHAHRVPGQSAVLLTFELLATEEPGS
jgi:hypothetical protein